MSAAMRKAPVEPALRLVRVMEEDPDLLAGLARREAAAAQRRATAQVLSFDVGRCALPHPRARPDHHLGLLVLEGVLTRTVRLGGKSSPELIGRGDLLRPWDDITGRAGAIARYEVTWTVLQPARIAILDARFAESIRPWPQVTANLLSRAVRRSFSLAFQRALLAQPRVDVRIVMLLSYFAERWGDAEPDGSVRLRLALTHELIAQLIGMRRPYVTTALGRLSRQGLISRRNGEWRVHEAMAVHARTGNSPARDSTATPSHLSAAAVL
jgi:CRP-like cAMP-binding protein